MPDGTFNKGSLNHFAYGAIGDWLFSRVAGIRQAEGSTAYKEIVIKPHFTTSLSFARATYYSMYGPISSHWQRTDTGLELHVSIPPNTTAQVHLPTENGWKIEEIGSGNYTFTNIHE